MTNTNKMMLIINPKSGVNSKESIRERLVEKLTNAGFDVDARMTERAGHATELAREAAASGYGSVAVCGGDGTINETATALVGTGVALAIVPSGSGNGLARHLGIPVDEMASVDIIAKRQICDIDCGIANGRLFFCTFGMGFDGLVSHRFAHEKRRGFTTYLKDTFAEFSHHEPMRCTVKIDGKEADIDEAFVIACCNASQYGNNAFIAPRASVTDGLLDVVIIPEASTLRTLLAGFDVIAANVAHNSSIRVARGAEIEITLDKEAYAHIDGEPIMAATHLNVVCHPKALKAYYNADKKAVRPFITPIGATLRDWGIAIKKVMWRK